MSEATPFGIYLHIPYCKAKCRYCDFYSAPGARGVPQSYVDALLRELAKNTRRPDTLYFGGGTPALLVPAQAAALIEAANPLPGSEITLEANPDVVTPETLRGFRAAGVTRISFGVQSADDAQLRRLGRTHTAAGAAQALTWAREAGFPEICGDIMLALPEYTNAEFDRTLALLRDGGCTHISAYLLKVEPGTAFYRNPPAGLPDGDAAADFYLYAVQQLEAAGYRQYEISNFARPGHEGRHNLLYWNCSDYWGVGPAAHSCVGNVRRFWPDDVQGFIAGTVAEQREGDCTSEDYLLMQLRLVSGLNIPAYERRGGRFTAAQRVFMRQCVGHGYAVWDGEVFRLTPAGMVVQNAILEELMEAKPSPRGKVARKGRMRAELPELPGNGLLRESPPSSVTCGDSFPRGGSLLAQQKTHTRKISACALFLCFYTSLTGQPSRSAAVRSWVTRIVGRSPASRFAAATASSTSSASMPVKGSSSKSVFASRQSSARSRAARRFCPPESRAAGSASSASVKPRVRSSHSASCGVRPWPVSVRLAAAVSCGQRRSS